MSVRSAVHRASFVSIPPLSRFLSAIPRWFTAARRIVRRPIAHRRAFSKIAKVKSNRYSLKSTNFYSRYFSIISFFPVIGTICQGALETEGRQFFTLSFDGLRRIFDVWFSWENTFVFYLSLYEFVSFIIEIYVESTLVSGILKFYTRIHIEGSWRIRFCT